MKRRKPSNIVLLTWYRVGGDFELRRYEDDKHCLCRLGITDWGWADRAQSRRDWQVQCFHPNREDYPGMQLGGYAPSELPDKPPFAFAEALAGQVLVKVWHDKTLRFDRTEVTTIKRRR